MIHVIMYVLRPTHLPTHLPLEPHQEIIVKQTEVISVLLITRAEGQGCKKAVSHPMIVVVHQKMQHGQNLTQPLVNHINV